jgi:hypothetical protein
VTAAEVFLKNQQRLARLTPLGPINSWDRQPYLTDAMEAGVPSLRQHNSYIHHNVLFNTMMVVVIMRIVIIFWCMVARKLL